MHILVVTAMSQVQQDKVSRNLINSSNHFIDIKNDN